MVGQIFRAVAVVKEAEHGVLPRAAISLFYSLKMVRPLYIRLNADKAVDYS